MWTVPAPTSSAETAYVACIGVHDAQLRARYKDATEEVVRAATVYADSASVARLHTLREDEFKLSDVSPAEMTRLYDARFARRGSAGRHIYDEIYLAPPYGRCPLCGHRSVTTLDHHLPKSRFPALAVNPLNLIPACSDCNKKKLDAVSATAEEEYINPYFDNLEDEQWLFGRIV